MWERELIGYACSSDWLRLVCLINFLLAILAVQAVAGRGLHPQENMISDLITIKELNANLFVWSLLPKFEFFGAVVARIHPLLQIACDLSKLAPLQLSLWWLISLSANLPLQLSQQALDLVSSKINSPFLRSDNMEYLTTVILNRSHRKCQSLFKQGKTIPFDCWQWNVLSQE